MITITRVNLHRCKFEFIKNSEKRIIDEVFKIFIDGAIFSDKYKEVDENGKRKWDGFHTFYDKNQFFDFGLLNELTNHLKKNKIRFEYKDRFKDRFIIEDLQISKEMREYQSESIVEFFKSNIGIIIVPTRGGKTFIASEISRLMTTNIKDFKILFYVDSVDLFNQAVGDISDYLKITKDEIGIINSRKMIFKNINVAMIQTCVSIFYGKSKNLQKRKDLTKFLNSVDFLIVDEIHDQSSLKRKNLFKKCKKLKFQLGLSATPYKQLDLMSAMKTKGFFGDECYRVQKTRLQKEGHLSIDKAILIGNEVDTDEGETYHELLTNQIHENEKRNQIIYSIIKICKKNRWKTLVLFNSKKHGRLISTRIDEKFICGDDSTEVRNIEKNRFLKGIGKILMASNIYKKGITLPEVEVVFLADGGFEGTNIIQKIGRVLGSTEKKKKSIVIDILDIGSKYFSEHSLNRLQIYDEEIGKKRIEIYEKLDLPEIESSIKEWLSANK